MLSDIPVVKQFQNGTYRLIPPEETLARVSRFMPIMGITRIANITQLDVIGIPVVMVCRPNSRSISVSQGKGLTLAAAKASGLMESIETYHAETITLPLKLTSYEGLRYTHEVVDVYDLPFIKNSAFHPERRLLWIEGHDLIQQDSLWVPYEMVHTDYTLPGTDGSGCFSTTTNGLASGNHVMEAVVHGINEVIERDSLALWELLPDEQKQRTRLNLDTVDDPACRYVLNQYALANVEVVVWNAISDVGLPAFLCAIAERTDHPLRRMVIASGAGCHVSRHIALLRALTEAAQSRLTVISGSRDDIFHDDYQRYHSPQTYQRFYESLTSPLPMQDFQTIPTWEHPTFNQDLAVQLKHLRSAGINRVIVVNLTKPELGIPVVRVVIPRLEGVHSIPQYQPGKRAQERMIQ